MSGWFAIKHGIRKHPIFRDRPDRLGAWVAMLDEAAWADTRQNVHGEIITVKRGELCASQAMLVDITGLSRKQLRTFLDLMKSEGAIRTRPGTKGAKSRAIISICNYEKYQTAGPSEGQTGAKQGPRKEQDKQYSLREADASEPVEVNVLSSAVWNAGKPFLASKGVNNPGALIGRWLKNYSPLEILGAIEAAQKSATEDPIPYITEALKGKPKASRFGQTETEEEQLARWKRIAGQ